MNLLRTLLLGTAEACAIVLLVLAVLVILVWSSDRLVARIAMEFKKWHLLCVLLMRDHVATLNAAKILEALFQENPKLTRSAIVEALDLPKIHLIALSAADTVQIVAAFPALKHHVWIGPGHQSPVPANAITIIHDRRCLLDPRLLAIIRQIQHANGLLLHIHVPTYP
jgi:hypothetical protein